MQSDGTERRLCWSKNRRRALQIMQALVLAGADPTGVLQIVEQHCGGGGEPVMR